MNPEKSTPQFTPESTPVDIGGNFEYNPSQGSPERAGEQSKEYEQNMKGIDRSGSTPPPPPALPPPPQDSVVHMTAPVPAKDDNPVIAGDDDLIEKEWVDKAKKIVAETRDDPYRRGMEVSKLQADYLRKRYGREIGVST